VARFFGLALDFAVPDLSLRGSYVDENGNEIADASTQNYEELLGAQTFNQNTLPYVEFFLAE